MKLDPGLEAVEGEAVVGWVGVKGQVRGFVAEGTACAKAQTARMYQDLWE